MEIMTLEGREEPDPESGVKDATEPTSKPLPSKALSKSSPVGWRHMKRRVHKRL
jgi:hypothetical protein